MTRKAVYPGTFDPVTYGHLDVIARASTLYDKVFIAVAHSGEKSPFFSVEERVAMMTEAVAEYDNVEVEAFDGLVVDYAVSKSSRVVVRGLRMISDFEYEFQMALMSRKLLIQSQKCLRRILMRTDQFISVHPHVENGVL